MCIRYALAAAPAELMGEFGLDGCPGQFPSGYNLGPSQLLPIVCLGDDGRRVLRVLRWGLIPPRAGGTPEATRINTRAETLPRKPRFFDTYRERRCIVPASGYFEWVEDGPGHRPNYIQPATGTLMGLAGIWKPAAHQEGDQADTFAILTVRANERLMPIHHRMPVVLEPDNYSAWLNPETPWAEVVRLSHSRATDRLLAYPVSLAVNQRENNTPEVIRPLSSAVT
ncbi:MAG TPA: SOS response-associated peptidase [Rhodocyclaceae bacterium]|nr:SOS response-associated peptidase [Rhodocyclaceae bacterium]